MSGRPVDFLRTVLPPGVVLSGLYGLEVVRDGVRDRPPGRGHVAGDRRRRRPPLRRAAGPPGMDVEPKGLSLTLHYRRPPRGRRRRGWRGPTSEAARSGLEVRAGQDVGRAAPADRRRQGHGARGAGRRARRGVLRRRRPGRPARVRRPRPPGRPGASHACGWRWRAPRRPPSCWPGPTWCSTARPRSSTSSAAWPGRPTGLTSRQGRSRSVRRASWSASQSAGPRAVDSSRRRAARAARSSAGMRRARSSASAVPATSNGGTSTRGLAHLVPHARLAGQAQHAVALVDEPPSLATRLRPSRIGLTSSTSARRSAATERG